MVSEIDTHILEHFEQNLVSQRSLPSCFITTESVGKSLWKKCLIKIIYWWGVIE